MICYSLVSIKRAGTAGRFSATWNPEWLPARVPMRQINKPARLIAFGGACREALRRQNLFSSRQFLEHRADHWPSASPSPRMPIGIEAPKLLSVATRRDFLSLRPLLEKRNALPPPRLPPRPPLPQRRVSPRAERLF